MDVHYQPCSRRSASDARASHSETRPKLPVVGIDRTPDDAADVRLR